MEMMNNYGILSIIAVGLGLAARYFLAKLWHTTLPGARIGAMAGLVMVYTAAVMLVLGQVYHYMLSTGGGLLSYHHMAMLTMYFSQVFSFILSVESVVFQELIK